MLKRARGKNLHYIFLFFISFLSTSSKALSTTPPISTWQGSYIGGYIGGGFGYDRTTTNVGLVTDTSYFSLSNNITAVNNSGTATSHPQAFIGGIQAGHDWAWKKIVSGVILDYGAFSFNTANTVSSATYPDNSGNYSLNNTLSTNWLFTLRARLGYLFMSRWPSLLYSTAGMAITQFKINDSFSDTSSFVGSGSMQNNLYEIGWTVGCGLDVAVLKQISVGLQYLYISMPTVTVASTISNTVAGFGIPVGSQTSPFTTSNQFHANLLKLALNYRFNE